MLKYDKKNIHDYIVENRHSLHKIPEIGTNLPNTQAFVIKKLEELKIEYKKNNKDSGIIAFIKGSKEGKTVALRADMDALPVKEETGCDFASTNGNMHACGHDAHAAILLGAAKILSENRDKINGNVKLIFQTGEEVAEGAKTMIEEGALENVDAIFGIHVGNLASNAESGIFIIQDSAIMASVDKIVIKVIGKGTHGATPESGIDPIVMAANIIMSLQTIITREISATDPVILSLCKINGGSAFNVIADTVEIEGTIRTFNSKVRDFLVKRIEEKAKDIAKSVRGGCEVNVYKFTPVTENNAKLTAEIKEVAEKIFSKDAVLQERFTPTLGGEDFAFFMEKVPACFALFSTKTSKNIPHHNSKFEIDESKLNMPAELMANWACDFLNK